MQSKDAFSSQDTSRKSTIVPDVSDVEFAVGKSNRSSIITSPLNTKTRGPPTIISEYPQLNDMTRSTTVSRPCKEDLVVPMSKYSPAFKSREWGSEDPGGEMCGV